MIAIDLIFIKFPKFVLNFAIIIIGEMVFYSLIE